MRQATAGPRPKSPPGTIVSPMEKISKNFAREASGTVRPLLSIVIVRECDNALQESSTVLLSSQNLTDASSKACSALTSDSSLAQTRFGIEAGAVMETERERAKSEAR